MAVVDDKKIIFGMHKVGKVYPPKKQVLKEKDIKKQMDRDIKSMR